jgi:tetratricopeptide (TPR) repeat protein
MEFCGDGMKTKILILSMAFALCASGVPAQSTTAVPASQSSAAASPSFTQPDEAKRAEAYSEYMFGHLTEQEYDDTGKPELADQAIAAYQKAFALDPDPAITERIAEVYAASQRFTEAIHEAQEALRQDPNNLAAHLLLSRIYIHNLGDTSAIADQKQTIASAIEQLTAVQKLDPSDTESQLWLAHLYGFQNKPDQAETVLKGILERSPASEGALEQLSELYINEGRASEAISLLRNASGGTDDATLYALLGNAYSKTNDNAKAEDAYRKAVALDPDDANDRRGLAEALVADDKFQEALEQYSQLAQLEPDSGENYLRLSQIYRHLGQLDKAESNILLAKKHSPDSLEVLYNEALVYEAQSRYKDAEQVLSDAIAGVKAQQQEGQSAPHALSILYEQLGMAYRDAGDFSTAERTFEDMRQLDPEAQKRAELLLIDTYRAGGDIKRAIAEAEKARAADANDQSLGVTYAMLLGDDGRTDDATKVLRGYLHGDATDREMYLNLAQVEQRGHRYADAEKDAQKALSLSDKPSNQEPAWFLLGAIYDAQKRYDEAEAMFKKSLAITPSDAMVLNYYGYMLADRGVRLDEALTMIHKAVTEDPANGAYLDSLGWVYFKQGKLSDAEQYLEQAVAHSNEDPTILGHLGDVYAKMGQSEQAQQVWEKALVQWQKALPADYEPSQVSQLQAKLKDLKRHVAQKSPDGEPKPQ